jgi:hypothetical protein
LFRIRHEWHGASVSHIASSPSGAPFRVCRLRAAHLFRPGRVAQSALPPVTFALYNNSAYDTS